MKIPTTILVGLAVILAACGQDADAPAGQGAGEPMADTGDMAGMDEMQPAATPVEVQGRGMVTAIDRTGKKITIDHEPIPEANWPRMNMGFAIDPAQMEGVRIGDQVAFSARIEGNAGTINTLSKE